MNGYTQSRPHYGTNRGRVTPLAHILKRSDLTGPQCVLGAVRHHRAAEMASLCGETTGSATLQSDEQNPNPPSEPGDSGGGVSSAGVPDAEEQPGASDDTTLQMNKEDVDGSIFSLPTHTRVCHRPKNEEFRMYTSEFLLRVLYTLLSTKLDMQNKESNANVLKFVKEIDAYVENLSEIITDLMFSDQKRKPGGFYSVYSKIQRVLHRTCGNTIPLVTQANFFALLDRIAQCGSHGFRHGERKGVMNAFSDAAKFLSSVGVVVTCTELIFRTNI
ncbi:uncharacterized protein [Lepisosteus oculatus]|uniref:uncharacterized protein isoform X1 n=1 Tax=Lepisosteus oculatus TaxID=7918 RepID=UPI0035F5140D